MMSIYEHASSDTYTDAIEAQYGTAEYAEQVLARAYVAAIAIKDEEIEDEIAGEMDAIDQWKEAVDYCDLMGIDTTDPAKFMAELF